MLLIEMSDANCPKKMAMTDPDLRPRDPRVLMVMFQEM